MTTPCKSCQASRETNGLWNTFDPSCLFCGARLIQKIGRLQLSVTESTARKRAVLADWLALGHSELHIRALAKIKDLALEPVLSEIKARG